MHLESILKAIPLTESQKCSAPSWLTQEKLIERVKHVPVVQCWIISSFTAMIFNHRQIIQLLSLCFSAVGEHQDTPVQFGNCKNEVWVEGAEIMQWWSNRNAWAIRWGGCFVWMFIRKRGGGAKIKKKTPLKSFNHKQRTSGRNSFIAIPC